MDNENGYILLSWLFACIAIACLATGIATLLGSDVDGFMRITIGPILIALGVLSMYGSLDAMDKSFGE